MKTAEIFTGKEFITVHEGSTFRINGMWDWPIGSNVAFSVKKGISVEASVRMKDGLGTELIVTSIIAEDELANMEITATDVEVETVSEDIVEEVADEEPIKTEFDTEHKLLVDKKKFTKKELVAYIKENELNIDTSKTKANLIKELESLGVVEYK